MNFYFFFLDTYIVHYRIIRGENAELLEEHNYLIMNNRVHNYILD